MARSCRRRFRPAVLVLAIGGLVWGSVWCLAQTGPPAPDLVARYFDAVIRDDARTVASCLQQGVSPSIKNAFGATGLHLAALNRSKDVVQTVLDALPPPGADTPTGRPLTDQEYLESISIDAHLDRSLRAETLNAQNSEGKTALHLASGSSPKKQGGSSRIVKMLLAAGADPNVQDRAGYTPLHTAARYQEEKIVKSLLEAGADPAIRTHQNRLAADLAGHPGIATLIAESGTRTVQPPVARPGPPAPQPGTPGDGPPRIFVVDGDGNTVEMTIGPDGELTIVKSAPGGVSPPIDPMLPPNGDDGNPFQVVGPGEAPLSRHQEMVRQRLGFPDFFNLTLLEDDLGTKTVNTRIEEWIYLRGGKVFRFCDGGCVDIDDFEPATDMPKTVVHYKPTQFVAGMTVADIEAHFGRDHFQRASFKDLGIESELLHDLEYLANGSLRLGFYQDRLMLVQATFRILPRP